MKKNRISLLVIGIFVGMVWQAQASLFTDSFTRANVTNATVGTNIGADYVITKVSGALPTFSITSGQVTMGAAGGAVANGVLSYQGFLAKNTAGNSFAASVDITLGAYNNGINPGLAFNFQDASNFYYARILTSGTGTGAGVLQISQMVNGAAEAVVNVAGLNLYTATAYTLGISSAASGVFTYTLTGGSVNLSNTVTDATGTAAFTDGYAGIYQNIGNTNTKFDNFSVTSIPEPATIGMMGLGALATLLLRRMRTRS